MREKFRRVWKEDRTVVKEVESLLGRTSPRFRVIRKREIVKILGFSRGDKRIWGL